MNGFALDASVGASLQRALEALVDAPAAGGHAAAGRAQLL